MKFIKSNLMNITLGVLIAGFIFLATFVVLNTTNVDAHNYPKFEVVSQDEITVEDKHTNVKIKLIIVEDLETGVNYIIAQDTRMGGDTRIIPRLSDDMSTYITDLE